MLCWTARINLLESAETARQVALTVGSMLRTAHQHVGRRVRRTIAYCDSVSTLRGLVRRSQTAALGLRLWQPVCLVPSSIVAASAENRLAGICPQLIAVPHDRAVVDGHLEMLKPETRRAYTEICRGECGRVPVGI